MQVHTKNIIFFYIEIVLILSVFYSNMHWYEHQ